MNLPKIQKIKKNFIFRGVRNAISQFVSMGAPLKLTIWRSTITIQQKTSWTTMILSDM